MNSAKLDVLWSPIHQNKFILWGPDITLYEVFPFKDAENKSPCIQISSNSCAQVVQSQSGAGVRCVDVSADPDLAEPLLALGHSNGNITLANLGQSVELTGLSGREFVPRYPRLCNSVSWSHIETNLLAAALDKHRSDHCILLWDVNRDSTAGGTPAQSTEESRPLAEMGLSETAHSVTWTHSSARTLIASMNMKFIKIFDLRDLSNKAVNVATTRYCYGVCADPNNEWQLASRGENVVCVWDTRSFDRPLRTLTQPKPLAKILWCPTRRNLLCSLQRDATFLRLHDVLQPRALQANVQPIDNITVSETESGASGSSGGGATGGPGSGYAHVVTRDVCPGPQALVSFSWHPRQRARILTLSTTGSVTEHTVCERVTVSWGAGRGGLVWSAGGRHLRTLPDGFYGGLHDVSYVMKRRANTDYGLKSDLWQNADLADDETLSSLWHFLALSKSLVEDGCIRNTPWKHPGVMSVLRAEADGGYRSEIQPSLLPDLPSRRVVIYKSSERTRALQLCSWGWGWENVSAGLERAEAEGQWCRAAALAAFHLRLRTALDILARAPHAQLRVVALALAGLSEERLWRDVASTAAPSLPDPYLRALFAFLAATTTNTTANSDMHQVLKETEMRLEDRVAFACIFLPDAKLQEYVRGLSNGLVEQGDLSGMLLTGASPEGITLVQRWLETTGDVQTAALVAVRTFTPDLMKDPRAQHWLDSYRNLLDSWQLWWARCALDTWASAHASSPAADATSGTRQVCIACSYCGKTVASPGGPPRPRPALSRLPPPAAKMKQMSACPHCRKPMPRCAVCTLHLGAGGGATFPAWITWCVACRHGGHAAHLLHWFQEHTECPVSSCSCRCITLDPPTRK